MINFSFHETFRYAFPSIPNTPFSPTAMTCATADLDPMLIFLTQTVYADELVYLNLNYDSEILRIPTPPGRDTTSGLGYAPDSAKLICCSSTTDAHTAYIIDPVDGSEVDLVDLSADSVFSPTSFGAQATATNGTVFVQAGLDIQPIVGISSTLQMRTRDGSLVGETKLAGRNVSGIAKTTLSWTLTDIEQDEIVILGPFGNEIAIAPGVGSSGGMQAIAWDNVQDLSTRAQVPLAGGGVGPVGSLSHPDTAWNPQPWLGRHRLYIANTIDQIIYAGYLVA